MAGRGGGLLRKGRDDTGRWLLFWLRMVRKGGSSLLKGLREERKPAATSVAWTQRKTQISILTNYF